MIKGYINIKIELKLNEALRKQTIRMLALVLDLGLALSSLINIIDCLHCAHLSLSSCVFTEKNPRRPPLAYLVMAGCEPLTFTNIFPYWEKDPSVAPPVGYVFTLYSFSRIMEIKPSYPPGGRRGLDLC